MGSGRRPKRRCSPSARCPTSCSAPAPCDQHKYCRTMPSKRSQIAMTDDEIAAYLESERVLNVATIGPTGHPHLVAMWYAMFDGQPAFWTFGKSQKILNLRRDPKMTGLVESGDSYDQLRGVELRGRGIVVEDY